MAVYMIGSVIKEARKRMGLSQEEVCYGICSVSALSKIENGSQNPTFKTSFALIERTGLSPHSFDHYILKSELKKHKLEMDILHRIYWKEDLRESLKAYSKIMCSNDKMDCQILETAKMLEENGEETTIEKINKVLSYTIKNVTKFYEKSLKSYTSFEMILLCLKSQKLIERGEKEEAQLILECLMEYWSRQDTDMQYRTTQYLYLLHVMLLNYYKLMEYSEAYTACLNGINICIKYGNLYLFIELLVDCGMISWKLEREEESEKWLRRALCACQALGDSRCEIIQKALCEVNANHELNLQIL